MILLASLVMSSAWVSNTTCIYSQPESTLHTCACNVLFFCAGVAAIDNLLYAVGGSNRDDGTRSNLNSMERYNPDKDEWEEMPPMHRSRGAASVTSLGGCLYAVGGYDSGVSIC